MVESTAGKWHVNLHTGEVGKCHAVRGGLPLQEHH